MNMKKKRLTSSVCKKLALVKEAAIRDFAKDGDVLKAASMWAKFVGDLPREVEYEDLLLVTKQKIEDWEGSDR